MEEKDFDKFLKAVIKALPAATGIPKDIIENYFAICETKPSQPIIKKSGETWVARFDGVDYLWINNCEPRQDVTERMLLESTSWKPISEIELTDEIAKLRPMVKIEQNQGTLYGYLEDSDRYNSIVIDRYKDLNAFKDAKLATIDDLP